MGSREKGGFAAAWIAQEEDTDCWTLSFIHRVYSLEATSLRLLFLLISNGGALSELSYNGAPQIHIAKAHVEWTSSFPWKVLLFCVCHVHPRITRASSIVPIPHFMQLAGRFQRIRASYFTPISASTILTCPPMKTLFGNSLSEASG